LFAIRGGLDAAVVLRRLWGIDWLPMALSFALLLLNKPANILFAAYKKRHMIVVVGLFVMRATRARPQMRGGRGTDREPINRVTALMADVSSMTRDAQVMVPKEEEVRATP
jgi:hypothetical protein